MRMKMKKLICTWRARLRVAPGPRLVPPQTGLAATQALGLAGTQPRMGILASGQGTGQCPG